MDYEKLDAALAAALSQSPLGEAARFRVSLRTCQPPDADEQAELQQAGVQGVAEGRKIFGGVLSPQAIDVLTSKPYVQRISLAQQIRPLSSSSGCSA